MDSFAPILIPTLCRATHLKRCIDSLARCSGADKTTLYIALEYPLRPSHEEGYHQIEEYLPSIKGFAEVVVIRRSENFGAVRNYKEALDEIFKSHDRYIYTEDDNEFSPDFLDYVNKGLEKFENSSEVFAVCGCNYPIQMPENYPFNHYFAHEFLAWGYGSWRNRWKAYSECVNLEYMRTAFDRNLKHYKLNNLLTGTVLNMRNGSKRIADDTLMTLYLMDKNMYSVLPSKTLSRNWGLDGSGLHCDKSDSLTECLTNREIDSAHSFTYDEGVAHTERKDIRRILNAYFSVKFIYKLRALCALVYYELYLRFKIRHAK